MKIRPSNHVTTLTYRERQSTRQCVDLEQLHNDSTTVTFSGEYRGATTQTLRRGKQTLAITHGHNKDHRPELKQLLFILTISADGAVPVHY